VVERHRFTPPDFEYDFELDELGRHGVTFNEAVDCFFSDFQVRRNKRYAIGTNCGPSSWPTTTEDHFPTERARGLF
jgi:hypothetical protein